MSSYEEALKRAQALARAQELAASFGTGSERNPDGTYGQPPEGFILDPRTGALTSQELMANREAPSVGEAFRTGTEEGVFWGGRDEAAGAVGALAVGSGGDAGERYNIEQMRARAELEAARRDHPIASMGGEILGAVLSGRAAARGAGKVASTVAPGAAKVARGVLARKGLTGIVGRAVAGAAAGASGGGAYGFMAGEGGLEPRVEQALNALKWGAGFGAGASLGGDAIQAYLNMRATGKATDAMVASTPSTEELLARGGQMIDDAIATGKAATPDQTKALAQDMRQILMKNGVIGPQGQLFAKGKPNIRDAFNHAEAYFGQSMTPVQMRSLREALQNAAQSADGKEARLGTILLKKFDDWATPMMPGIPAANAVYAAGKRGELIDEAVELAGIRAGQYTGSGFENALRVEFRGLARKIAKGQIKGFTPEQIKAINRVASGGPIENLARGLGKAAPTGIVSAGLGGGIPYLVGNSIGGPVVGGVAGAGALAAGATGRKVATAMQTKNAAVANALARGGTRPAITANPNTQRVASELLRNALMPATQ